MKKKILLLIETYSNDLILLEYAIAFAKNLKASIEMFDVQVTAQSLQMESVNNESGGEIIDNNNVLVQAEEQMKALQKVVKHKWKDTNYKLVKTAMYGKLPTIENYWLEEIEASNPDLVVMRVENELNLMNELFGTPETEIAEKANCPVLLLPKNINKFREFKKLAYFLYRDKPIEEANKEIQFLVQIARESESTINVYYLTDAEKDAAALETSVVRTRLTKGVDFNQLLVHDFEFFDSAKTLDFLLQLSINQIIAFPKQRNSFIERLTQSDHTKRMILKAQLPVIVV